LRTIGFDRTARRPGSGADGNELASPDHHLCATVDAPIRRCDNHDGEEQPVVIAGTTAHRGGFHPVSGARTLVTLGKHGAGRPHGHDAVSRQALAQRLAALLGWSFGGAFDAADRYVHPLYFVPEDALVRSEADLLGIVAPDQLYGGVVPLAFVATKVITHPVVRPDATAPRGWSHAFARHVEGSVLRGFAAFTGDDARRAMEALLAAGPIRIKCGSGIGGRGQYLANTTDEANSALAAIDAHELAESGIVVEEHLAAVTTYSVGQVEVGGLVASYCGTQQSTRNHRGHEVYGGSTLDVVRGGFESLCDYDLHADAREAVDLASRYDQAARVCYDGLFASRRNYDVAIGADATGARRAGVLEQSWRIGGASGAEILALEAFQRDPARGQIRCATVEAYDGQCAVPADAFVYFRGDDAGAGPVIKYAVELHDADAG